MELKMLKLIVIAFLLTGCTTYSSSVNCKAKCDNEVLECQMTNQIIDTD